ncbi:MAG: homoserine O-acetyltransferase [Desulfoarculaceae bacterium]|nr:homoserine O-acetyltransferase [Desulfoarculaceae bacterium]
MSKNTEHECDGISVGLVEKKLYTFAEPPNELTLASGARLGPISVAYETMGTLNDDKSNVILIAHALSGDSHVAGYYSAADPKPGWWNTMVGPGKGIDTDRYFVICSNVLGSCMGTTGPSSTNPATGRPYGLDFPMVTIGDMVKVQKALLDHLGIGKLLAVIGGSIGGMQVLEWAISYPETITAAILLATTTRHSALAIAFNEIGRQAIMSDPNFNKGDYYSGPKPDLGLALARMVGHVTYLSDEVMRSKFGRRLQDRDNLAFDFEANFQVESYLRHQGSKFVQRFDANSFLYITKAADYFDVGQQHGNDSEVEAFAKVKAKILVISFTSDWLYPTYQSRDMVNAMKKNGLDVSFCEIEAKCGHDAFLLPNERQSTLINRFLDRVSEEEKHDAL